MVEHLITVYIVSTVSIPIFVTVLPVGTTIAGFVPDVIRSVLIIRNIYVHFFQNHLMYVMDVKTLKTVHSKNHSILQLLHRTNINYACLNHGVGLQLMKKKFYVWIKLSALS